MKQIDELFTEIAREHLGIETLEERHRDSLDFHDVSVRGVKDALLAAYRAGQRVAAHRDNPGIPRDSALWHVVNETGMPEIRAGGISIADIRFNGHNMKHGAAYARRIVAAVNACNGITTQALEDGGAGGIWELLEGAIETAEGEGLHDAWWYAEARALLAEATAPHQPGNAPSDPPIVAVTVRGGLIADMDATQPVHVVVEDWDIAEDDTGEKPARNVWKLDASLADPRAERLRRLIAND